MSEKKILIIFLSQFDLTSSKIEKILDYLGENANLKTFKKTKFPDTLLKAEIKTKMAEQAEEEIVQTYVKNLEDRGIKITTKYERDFPKKLIHFDDCPFILYYMGDLSLADKPSVSIVGSRKPTSYGRMLTEKFTAELALAGMVIISGLAYGVDSIAHRKCLEVGGKTIAVLGGGFEHIYPSEHQSLALEIAQKGLLISEFRPKMSAVKYNFPLRNRIIAGLANAVLIPEAKLKSGTIHTKDFALDYGVDVYAVPGNIDSILSGLPNDLINSGQATCVIKPDDLLYYYQHLLPKQNDTKNIRFVQQKISFDELEENEKSIMETLKNGMMSVDELTKCVKIPANILNSCLTTLEIRGLINRLPGGMLACF